MKPSDLSNGDWVQVIRTGERRRIEEMMMITTARRKEIMLGLEGDEFYFILLRQEGGKFFLLSEVKPIPVDGEMLEKNGFIRSDSEPKFFHPYEESEEEPAIDVVEMVYDPTHNEWTGEFFGPNGLAMQVRIRYVHELQRILRFMGIDDDIVV